MMNKNILAIIFTSFLLFACSGEEVTDTLTINSIESSKEIAYTDETVTFNVDASGFTDLEVTSTDSDVFITKIDATTYNVNSSKYIEDVEIKFTFYKEEVTKVETVNVTFFEHGVTDNNMVDGIEVGVDTSEKVEAFYGVPNYTFRVPTGAFSRWHYFDLGLYVVLHGSTNVVTEIRLFGVKFSREYESPGATSGIYPYTVGNSLKVSNLQLTTDAVLKTYGEDYSLETVIAELNLHRIYYKDIKRAFFFRANEKEDALIKGVPILYVTIY